MPTTEELAASAAKAAARHRPPTHRNSLTVVVLGNRMHMARSLYGAVAKHLGWNLVDLRDTADHADLGFVWKPWIYGGDYDLDDHVAEFLRRFPDAPLINATDFTDDKASVEQEFERHFGYPLRVDARRHAGPAVRKSRVNARHDGVVLACPVQEMDNEAVYQAVIDNRVGVKLVEDIRVSIVGYEPVFCYLKYRPDHDRFSDTFVYATLRPLRDCFAEAEIERIGGFCARIGLEVGEIDVLRDGATNRIFIVDANNTPFGPSKAMTAFEKQLVVSFLSDAFCKAYLRAAP